MSESRFETLQTCSFLIPAVRFSGPGSAKLNFLRTEASFVGADSAPKHDRGGRLDHRPVGAGWCEQPLRRWSRDPFGHCTIHAACCQSFCCAFDSSATWITVPNPWSPTNSATCSLRRRFYSEGLANPPHLMATFRTLHILVQAQVQFVIVW